MSRPVTPLSDKDMEGTDVENMDLIMPNAVPNFDDVLDIGLPSQVGRAAGCFNSCGGEEDVYPTREAKRQRVLGWRCDDGGGVDFVLPSAVPDIVPNNGHLLERHAGSSRPRGGVKEFTPTFEEANSPKENSKNKVLNSIKKAWKNVKHPFLPNDKVETLIPSELNADSANPDLKDDAGLASSEMKPDKRKAFFGCLRRGKVESMPTPLLKADPAIPDVREVVDPASQSKTYVSLKKQKASKSRKSNLQGEKVTVVPTQQPMAISDIPVGMDVPALASPQSKKIHPDSRKTLTQRILGCFRRGKVESMPISQIEADPAIPDAREVIDLADSQSSVGLKKQKQKASKSRLFHNPLRKKGKKVKKDADPAIPDAMDGADLASFDGIDAANARLQKIGAIPTYIGLKGGGNPDPNKASGSKDDKVVRPKALGNPRRPWIHNPSRPKNPKQEDDKVVRPKALGKPRTRWPEEVNVLKRAVKGLSKMKLDDPEPKETISSEYELLKNKVIGRGTSGTVYKGIRKWDGSEVAIKQIHKRANDRTLKIPGHPEPLITEVALLLKLKDSFCPNVIQLYDWYETRQFYNLVLQYPQESVSLGDFVSRRRNLCEDTARVLMRQAVLAVKQCLDKGVVHTDLHAKNFLVQESTLSLKLIDFGLGHLLKHEGYKSFEFKGAGVCIPPEIKRGRVDAMPANVWALGALLYFMVFGSYPYPFNKFSLDILKKKEDLSKEICDLLRWCLAMDPDDRPTLRELLYHEWFN